MAKSVATKKKAAPVFGDVGLFENIPASEYHAYDAMSASRLKKLARSPMHFKSYTEQPEEKTPALILGSAVHTVVLEPHKFVDEFSVLPDCDRRTKEGKATYEKFLQNAGNNLLITESDYQTCDAIYKSVQSHPAAKELIQAEGLTECSLIWYDKETGIKCKGRPDRYIKLNGENVVVDLKTTQNASPSQFPRQAAGLLYHFQAAMYLDGLSEINQDPHTRFIFIAVEKEPPFAVGVYELAQDAIELGRQEYKRLLAIYKECLLTERWPGYGQAIQEITLPTWAFNEVELPTLVQ